MTDSEIEIEIAYYLSDNAERLRDNVLDLCRHFGMEPYLMEEEVIEEIVRDVVEGMRISYEDAVCNVKYETIRVILKLDEEK